MPVEISGWTVGTLLGSFVMLYCYLWWINSRFEEIIKELKRK